MPTPYVKKLAKKHNVSTKKAEGKWAKAKKSALKQGHKDDFGYVTSIFKKMMHEHKPVALYPLKDLINGMTFKEYILAEEVGASSNPVMDYLGTIPEFKDLPFKAKKDVAREVSSLGVDIETLSPEHRANIDNWVRDIIIDKTQEIVGKGFNIGPGEDDAVEARRRIWDMEQELADLEKEKAPPPAPRQRMKSGARHIAAMRQPAVIPTEEPEVPPARPASPEGERKGYYKPWSELAPEQKANRSKLGSKHGLIYRLKNSNWFNTDLDPIEQEEAIEAIRSGKATSAAEVKALFKR
jgi:hypothetical protein